MPMEGLKKADIPARYALFFGSKAEMMADKHKELPAVFSFSLFFTFALLGIQFIGDLYTLINQG